MVSHFEITQIITTNLQIDECPSAFKLVQIVGKQEATLSETLICLFIGFLLKISEIWAKIPSLIEPEVFLQTHAITSHISESHLKFSRNI